MKQHEILQKIIDAKGSCEGAIPSICNKCVMGSNKSCVSFVNNIRNSFTNEDYLEVAKKLLAEMEVSRIILGEEIE